MTAPASAWRRIGVDLLRFDRAGLRWAAGLRMAIGTVLAVGIGYASGSWASGAAAAGGALAVGIGSVLPAARPRLAMLAATAAMMAAGTFAGAASGATTGVHVVIGALIAFGCGLLVAVEPTLAGIGINTVVAFYVYGRFAAPPLIALRTAGLVAAGGGLQILLIVAAYGRPKAGRAMTGLGRAYAALADLAGDLHADQSTLTVGQAIDAAATDLEFSLSSDPTGEAWTNLASEAHRIRLELLSLATSAPADAAVLRASFDEATGAVASLLRCLSETLAAAQLPADLTTAHDRAQRALESFATAATAATAAAAGTAATAATVGGNSPPHLAVRGAAAARALAGQLRAVAALIPDAVNAPPPKPTAVIGVTALRSAARVSVRGVRGFTAVIERMAANMTPRSDAFRHAARLTIVLTIASSMAHALDLGRGYWIALTAALVLRPEFSVTFTRGVGRALGTVVGVGWATAVAGLVQPHGWALVVWVGISAWVAGGIFLASYPVFSAAITGVVVFLLAGLDASPVTTGEDRLLATLLGAGLALLAYLLWPTWGERPAAEALADLAKATHSYVIAVLRAYADSAADVSRLGVAARGVRLARTNAEAAVARSLADPGPHRLDDATAAAVFAGMRRLAIAGHTLRLRRPARGLSASGVLGDLIDALDTELAAVVARLRFGRVTYVHEPLRARHHALQTQLAGHDDEPVLLLLAETDEIVDATNSLLEVLNADVTAASSRAAQPS